MSQMQIGIGIGLVMGPIISTILMRIGGFHLPFITLLIFLLSFLILGLFIIPHKQSK